MSISALAGVTYARGHPPSTDAADVAGGGDCATRIKGLDADAMLAANASAVVLRLSSSILVMASSSSAATARLDRHAPHFGIWRRFERHQIPGATQLARALSPAHSERQWEVLRIGRAP